jgi:hypothetical protein
MEDASNEARFVGERRVGSSDDLCRFRYCGRYVCSTFAVCGAGAVLCNTQFDLDRFLPRRQWRRRLGQLDVERVLQLQHIGRACRRDGGGVCTFGCQTTNNSLGTVRGRLGYAGGTWMPYVTGGLAFGNFQAGNIFGTSNTTNAGWTLGAGVEYAFAGNWTVKAEYLYVDLGNFNCSTCIAGTNVSSTMNLVRGGVNFHF